MTTLSAQQMFDSARQEFLAARYDQAQALCQAILASSPGHADALHMLGVLAHQCGQFDQALELLQKAIDLSPQTAAYHCDRAMVLVSLKQWDRAEDASRAAIAIDPQSVAAHLNLGLALRGAGKTADALVAFQQAALWGPQVPEALVGVAVALMDQRKYDQAVVFLNRALAIRPNYADALFNLGTALGALGKPDQAVAAMGHALAVSPKDSNIVNSLGDMLKTRGQHDQAIACFRKALTLDPRNWSAYNNLGLALQDLALLDDAQTCFDQAIRIAPLAPQPQSNRLFCMHFHGGYDTRAMAAELAQWNRRLAQPLIPASISHANDRRPDRRLRIAYISPDFREHCQALFTVPLLSHHNHSDFEIFCYSDAVVNDAVTRRLAGLADHWRNTASLSDQALAQQIRADQIDIAVDLTMHMANNRLLMLAQKPAPIQVSWLAYPGSTGLQTIDYRLSDPHLDPPGLFETHFVEKTLRLADTFWCYDPLAQPLASEPRVGLLPAIANGYVTFGCLNSFCKLSDATLDLWAPVLRAMPDSRLIVLAPAGLVRQVLLEKLQQRGVDAHRVEIADRRPRLDYLQLYGRIDIALDTIAYNGHTTSLDGLWMGVPVVTMVGQTVAGRGGWSLLCNLQLKDLAARTPEHFCRVAVGTAKNLPRLAELRAGLRARMTASPLMDAPRFAASLETLYRQMWSNWIQSSGK